MKKRIPLVLDTDKKSYDLAVENMISEGGPVLIAEREEEKEAVKKEKDKPLH